MKAIQTLIDSGQWQELEDVVDARLATNQTDDLFYVECIYLLHFRLLNGASLPKIEFERVHVLLKRVFGKSRPRFRECPRYLFFVGYFIALCDWCFGLDGVAPSHEMLRRASELEPDSLLFRWGYSFSTDQPDSKELSLEISQDQNLLDSLASSGRAGENMAEIIRDLPYFLNLPRG